MLMFWVGCLLLFDFWTSVSANWENNQPILFHVYFPCTNLFFADKFFSGLRKFSRSKSNSQMAKAISLTRPDLHLTWLYSYSVAGCIYLFFMQVLKDALTKLHAEGIEDPFYQPVHTYVLNPKVSNYFISLDFFHDKQRFQQVFTVFSLLFVINRHAFVVGHAHVHRVYFDFFIFCFT